MANCNTYYFQGVADCKALRESLSHALFMNKRATIAADKGAALADYAAIVAPKEANPTGVLIKFKSYEVTTDEAEMSTTSLGVTEQIRMNPPKIRAYADMNYLDYINFFNANGKEFEVVLFDEQGNTLRTETTAGLKKGARAKVFVKIDVPKIGADLQNECQFDIVFSNREEWQYGRFAQDTTAFTVPELEDLNPVGINIVATSAYLGGAGAGTINIKATYRGEPSRPYTGLTAAGNYQLLQAFADLGVTIAVTATGAALGDYMLTIKNGTPANIVGDVIIQAFEDDANNRIAISNPLRIKV